MAIIHGDDDEGALDVRAKGQNLVGIDGETNFLFGDAESINNSKGGNDVLTGGTGGAGYQVNYLYGDAYSMYDSKGGNDVLTGGAGSTFNILYGDATNMYNSQGGNDVLNGGSGSRTTYI